MTTLLVTEEGKIELHQGIVKHLGLGPGDCAQAVNLPDGRVELRAVSKGHPISQAFGILHNPQSPRLSTEEINTIIEQGWAGEP
jgi:hypothetical protein